MLLQYRVMQSVLGRKERESHISALATLQGISFVPLVVETLGGWSHGAVETVEAIGLLKSQRLGLPAPQSISHTFQQLAIILWRGNTCVWAMCVPITLPIVDGVV